MTAMRSVRNSPTVGFTLMEVLSAISIIAVVTSIALPSVNGFFASQQASAAAKSFLANVRLARFEAIRNGMPTRIVLTNLATTNQYRVQAIKFNPEDNFTIADFFDNNNWISLLDQDYEEVPPDITVTLNDSSLVYFTPDGRATDNWVYGYSPTPMVPRQIHFCYRDTATMTIHLTGAGGISSTEFYEEQ